MDLKIPVGISDFARIRREGYYYVDKSGLIAELLSEQSAAVTLLTRPRRFGKTLAMSMLAHFFDIRKDSEEGRELFCGLEIAKRKEICEKWMNQYPTIFLSFKDIDGLSYEDAYGQLSAQIAELYRNYTYLLEDRKMDEDDREAFLALKAKKGDPVLVSRSLAVLMRMLAAYHQKPVVLLLDEYDVPLAKASSGGYYGQMLHLLRVLMSTALKDNTSLCFAVITGCLKISKESIFTGTNNFVSDTISRTRFHEYFGFTQEEVDGILADARAWNRREKVKEWYDGYHFGACDVYCPWDVMNYVYDLQAGLAGDQPVSYWKNTSDNAIIRSFIDYAGSAITKKLEILLAGGSIYQKVDENLTYEELHSSEDNFWSILYLSGYLTRVGEADLAVSAPEGTVALAIPNAEIREIYRTSILGWFADTARTWNRKELFDAVWAGKSQELTEIMSRLLRRTISYHDYKEDFYHAFLAGIFAGAGYVVESNKEHGEGRSDVVVCDPAQGRVAVFEVKYSAKAEQMEQDCDRAIRQMDEKMYAEEYEDQYSPEGILCYGIAFYKKRCLVKKRK